MNIREGERGSRAGRGGGVGGGETVGGVGGGEAAPPAKMVGEETAVAPLMRHLEARTKLEMRALESEFSRLMAYGDGAQTGRICMHVYV